MPAANQISVFDRALLRQRRARAAARLDRHGVLYDEAAAHLAERLKDVTRRFSSVLVLGAGNGVLLGRLKETYDAFIVTMDAAPPAWRMETPFLIGDEEFLPFAAGSFDLVIGNLGLHWVNDLPGALAQINYALKPDGLFLAAMPGGNTLYELRTALLEAEMKIAGGISPRLSPTLDLQTASGLLQRAGFALPVADQESVTLTYPGLFALMHELRGMGETNAHSQRLRHGTRPSLFREAERVYRERFADAEGFLPATFDLLFLHGWKPAA